MNRIAAGLQAALLLAVGRADALALLDAPPGQPMLVARRSFWAIALALPGFLMLRALELPSDGFMHGLGRELLGFVIGWLGFILISHQLAGRFGSNPALWPRFVAAWNFCNVVQYMMLMVASLPGLAGAPDFLVQTCWVVAIGWAMWLEYFATRHAMQLPVGTAIGWVVTDLAIGLVMDAIMSAFA